MLGEARLRLRPPRLLAGQGEPIFDALPERVLQNLWNPASETAVLWNLIYPLAQAGIRLEALLALRPLWGSAQERLERDSLKPYFWGFDLAGQPLPGSQRAAERVEGSGPAAEVDLYLLGRRHLVLVEAKHLSAGGSCGRYQTGRCPEIHPVGEGPCRYWEPGPAAFSTALDFGPRPTAETAAPPCNRHYQFARLLLLGQQLADELRRTPHLWLLVPQKRWRALASDWLDFAGRVSDRDIWQRLRVIAWERIASLSRGAPQIPK